jgi:hypothetical protein
MNSLNPVAAYASMARDGDHGIRLARMEWTGGLSTSWKLWSCLRKSKMYPHELWWDETCVTVAIAISCPKILIAEPTSVDVVIQRRL